MGIIQQLPEEIAIKIAAGEVIERPASVVKELVENALDAGASEIEVALEDGGKTKIEIRDNGSGMDREDAVKAFLRHGTSKIRSVDDLLQVTTLGFRGEALAAIGASAEVELITTLKQATEGTQVIVENGRITLPKVHAPLQGTRISVRKLFDAIPARQKFLKSDATEWKVSLEILIKQMIVHPRVAFRIVHNSREVFNLPTQTFEQRVAALWKVEQDRLVPSAVEIPHLKLEGVVGKPELAYDAKGRHFFAVNGHPVSDKMVARSLKDAFGTLLPPAVYPAYALNLTLHPGMVDVNIHPRKDEVRFVNPQEVYRFIRTAISQAIEPINLGFNQLNTVVPPQSSPRQEFLTSPVPSSSRVFSNPTRRANLPNVTFVRTFESSPVTTPDIPDLVILTLDNCFLITVREEKLLLIDQHAAHERILYNQLWKQENDTHVVRQPLLVPQEITLAPDDEALVAEHLGEIEALGFGLRLESDRYVLYEVPQLIKSKEPIHFFHSLLSGLKENRFEPELKDFKHKLFATMACKAAIKAGDVISEAEQRQLISDLFASPQFTCPHGRPSHIEITPQELEKLFKRTGF